MVGEEAPQNDSHGSPGNLVSNKCPSALKCGRGREQLRVEDEWETDG